MTKEEFEQERQRKINFLLEKTLNCKNKEDNLPMLPLRIICGMALNSEGFDAKEEISKCLYEHFKVVRRVDEYWTPEIAEIARQIFEDEFEEETEV